MARANLRDLVRLNRWLGGYRVLRTLFAEFTRPWEAFSVLDVGAASGDMGAALRRFRPLASVTSLDRSPAHLDAAPPPRVAADAFRLPFADGSFDVVMCSLLLHHFTDARIVELLGCLRACARRALLVIDLERHPLAYYFVPATRWLLRWSEITVHDGPASVEASFSAGELERLAREAGLLRVKVRRHLPWFRWSLLYSFYELPVACSSRGRAGGAAAGQDGSAEGGGR